MTKNLWWEGFVFSFQCEHTVHQIKELWNQEVEATKHIASVVRWQREMHVSSQPVSPFYSVQESNKRINGFAEFILCPLPPLTQLRKCLKDMSRYLFLR